MVLIRQYGSSIFLQNRHLIKALILAVFFTVNILAHMRYVLNSDVSFTSKF